jgi:hypothetical protein
MLAQLHLRVQHADIITDTCRKILRMVFPTILAPLHLMTIVMFTLFNRLR